MSDPGLKKLLNRLSNDLAEDKLVQTVTHDLRKNLSVDRVVLYYFYRQWSGRVTFESLSAAKFSIFGSTGPDECFNDEYAALYERGRVSVIADIEQAAIAECHRDFLRTIKVRANLVVPILTPKGLWGLLAAHNCQSPLHWSENDLKVMQQGATTLANAASIRDN
jgi:GAF domain-containing protein